ncbi:MAG: type III-B CRISPR module-associated protein Cmr5 [Acidobacteria bacterium]|nr:type III-B CRISPR module-associated protein Cmr5 [Acidobacteriota bacterium]
MSNRNQRYAARVFEQIEAIPPSSLDKYEGMAQKLPVLIRTAGLVQALAFVESRDEDEQKLLLDHLAEVIGAGSRENLLQRSRTAPLPEYIRLTREALAALHWYKRFAQTFSKTASNKEGGQG